MFTCLSRKEAKNFFRRLIKEGTGKTDTRLDGLEALIRSRLLTPSPVVKFHNPIPTGEVEDMMIFTQPWTASSPVANDVVSRRLVVSVDGQADQIFNDLPVTLDGQVEGVRAPEDVVVTLSLYNIDNKGNPSAAAIGTVIVPDLIGPDAPVVTFSPPLPTGEE